MNWLSPILLLLVTWIAVFAQSQGTSLRDFLGTPPSVLPALVVYAAFTHGIVIVAILTTLAGLWIDSLSGSRLGTSVPALFLLGFILHTRQHLLLRDQRYAQFWLGFAGGVGVPLATAVILQFSGREPAFGWFTLRQLAVLGLLNGVACPACFLLFDRLRRMFEYQPADPVPYRLNREMKRGRT
jgi:cell shape-determining protein MreD